MNEQKLFQTNALVPMTAEKQKHELTPEKLNKINGIYLLVLAGLVIAFGISMLIGHIGARQAAKEAAIRDEAVAQYKAQVQAEIEAESAAKMEEAMSEAAVKKQEIEMITRLFEGVRNFNYDMGSLMTYGWCAYNRVENANYGNTLDEVIHQANQWTGYSDDLPIVKDYYRIAEKLVDEVYNSDARPCTPDFVIAVLAKDGVYLKTSLDNNYSTRSWQWGW